MLPFRRAARVDNVVRLRSRLTRDALRALLAHETAAVWVSDFYKRANRERAVGAIRARLGDARNWEISQGEELVRSNVDTIGTPFNVARGRGDLEKYFDEAAEVNLEWRRDGVDQDFLSPFDKLRLELDEVHEHGCVLGAAKEGGRKKLPGLIRIMRRSAEKGLIHVDDVAVMSPERGVFSANVYLQNPRVGGELDIWPIFLPDEAALMEHALPLGLLSLRVGDASSQRALREEFLRDVKPLTLRPEEGDLILLNVQRPHCVRGPILGARERFSAQSFLIHGGEGDDDELEEKGRFGNARVRPLRIEG